MHSVSFTDRREKYSLSFHIMEQNLFVNGTEFKAKDSKIVVTPSCLGNISKDWSVDNMNDAGLIGYVYDFSVHYDAIAVEKYLMKKNNMIYKCLGLLKKSFLQD